MARAHADRDITVLSWPNREFTASLIAAIAQTDCDLVAIFDAGDISHSERIARQVALARSDPDAAVIGAHVGLQISEAPFWAGRDRLGRHVRMCLSREEAASEVALTPIAYSARHGSA